jgi:hypothetical protein
VDPATFLFIVLFGQGRTLESANVYGLTVMEHPESQTLQVSAATRDDKVDDILSVQFKRRNTDVWLVVKEGARELPHPFIKRNVPRYRCSFDCTIPIPPDVQRVVFGKQKAVIWTRASSAKPRDSAEEP